MSAFDKREQAFEEKFAHDEALRFKAHARRDKLVGLWAAELMGLSHEEAKAYAESLIRHDMQTPGDEDVIGKLRADFEAKGVRVSEHQVRRTLQEKLADAVKEIEEGR